MPRKPKTISTPAATPPPAPTEKRAIVRLTEKARAQQWLKNILALPLVAGDQGSVLAAHNLGEMLARLPDPTKRTGPLQAGDWCEPVDKARSLPPHRLHAAPYKLTEVWDRGRITYCQIEDRDGRASCCPLSDLRRCAAPVAVPDVPLGDPAALGEDGDEPAVGDEVRA